MTKYEMLESKLKSIQVELRRVEKDGTGCIQYAEKDYFSKNCKVFSNRAYVFGSSEDKLKNCGPLWDNMVKIAKRLFGVRDIPQLTYEQADICVAFLNEFIDLYEKYESLANTKRRKP